MSHTNKKCRENDNGSDESLCKKSCPLPEVLKKSHSDEITEIYLSDEESVFRVESAEKLSNKELGNFVNDLTSSPRLVKCAHCENTIKFDPNTDHIAACDKCLCTNDVGVLPSSLNSIILSPESNTSAKKKSKKDCSC